jgi:hypothetical protein
VRDRWILTAIWLLSLVLCVVLVELYIGKQNSAGLVILLDEDRIDALKPVAVLYGGYLTGILGFWFLKPFKAAGTSRAGRARFWIAAACSIFFNTLIVYYIGHGHFDGGEGVLDDISTAGKVAGLLSFLVAPVNAYYFGMKMQKDR